MMRNPTRTDGRFEHAVRRAVRRNITYSSGAVRAAVPLHSSVGAVRAARFTQHNTIRRISRRVEAPAPSQVVGPSCGRYAATAPEGDPPRFLSLGYPCPLGVTILPEGHDVAHGGGLYAA